MFTLYVRFGSATDRWYNKDCGTKKQISSRPVIGQKHPGEYRWSSYGANALEETDVLIKSHPQYLRQVRQATYRALFDTHVDEHSLSAIRIRIRESLNQCRALGSEIFNDQIEHALARCVRPGKSGRPKKLQSAPCFDSYNIVITKAS